MGATEGKHSVPLSADVVPEQSHGGREAASVGLAAAIIAGLSVAWAWALIQFVSLLVQPGVESVREEVARLNLR